MPLIGKPVHQVGTRVGSSMSVTLSQVLTLVGRLDDTPGFETPRERFREFLSEHVSDVETLKTFLEEAELSLGEQSHRALQDAVVVLGRFLGFDTTFGAYQRLNGGVQYQGHWRSHQRLTVVLEILTEHATRADVDELSRSLAAFAAAGSANAESACLGLFVLAPSLSARGLGQTVLAQSPTQECRVASTRSLLFLAEMLKGGRITHDEIVRLFVSVRELDLVVELLGRFAGGGRRPASIEPTAGESEPDFWVAAIDRAGASGFEQIVKSAVGQRGVLGVCEDATGSGVACSGDWVCFFLPGKGVVGVAQVSAAVDAGELLMRDSDRSGQLYRLQRVELFQTPVVPDPDTEHTLVSQHERAGGRGPLLLSVSRQKFEGLTAKPSSGVFAGPPRLEPPHIVPARGLRMPA